MSIYFTRHGESEDNKSSIIGGNSSLTEKGIEYSILLGEYLKSRISNIWTSDLNRTKETAKHAFPNHTTTVYENLNEIFSGNYESLDLNTIKIYHPTEYKTRNEDKLNNKYPNGESYVDLQKRVEPLLKIIPNGTLIITHKAVCRVIHSFLTKTPLSECVDLDINLHTLYRFENSKLETINFNL